MEDELISDFIYGFFYSFYKDAVLGLPGFNLQMRTIRQLANSKTG